MNHLLGLIAGVVFQSSEKDWKAATACDSSDRLISKLTGNSSFSFSSRPSPFFFFFLAFVSLRWYNLNSPLKLKQFQLKQTFYHFHSQHLEQICFTFTMDFVGWTAVTSFTLKTGICGQLRCLTRLKLITFVLYILMMTLLSLHFIFSVFVEIRMRF